MKPPALLIIRGVEFHAIRINLLAATAATAAK